MKSWFGWIGIGVGLVVASGAVVSVKLRNERAIIVINGEKITRGRFVAALERQHGADVLRRMVRETLIIQEAQRKGHLPRSGEIQAELAKLREQEPDLERQLRLNGRTLEDLEGDLRGRLALARLLTAGVKLSEGDVRKLWETHRKQFDRPEARKVAMILARTAEDAKRARRLLSDGIPAEFASQNAGMALPGGRSQLVLYRGQFNPELERQVFSLTRDTVSPVLRVGKAFAVVKVLEAIPAQPKRFEDLKGELTLRAKLGKAKSEPEFLQALQKAAKIEIKSDRYEGLTDTALAAADPRTPRARVAQRP